MTVEVLAFFAFTLICDCVMLMYAVHLMIVECNKLRKRVRELEKQCEPAWPGFVKWPGSEEVFGER